MSSIAAVKLAIAYAGCDERPRCENCVQSRTNFAQISEGLRCTRHQLWINPHALCLDWQADATASARTKAFAIVPRSAA